MDNSDDNTVVLHMKRDLDAFLDRGSDTDSFSRKRTNLENSYLDNICSTSNQGTEREKDEQLRHRDIIAARTRITQLEAQLSAAQLQNSRAQIEWDKDKDNLLRQVQYEKEAVAQIRHRLKVMSDREKSSKTETVEATSSLDAIKRSLEQKIYSLQKDKLQLEMQLQKAEQSYGSRLMELKTENMRKDTEIQIGQSEVEECQAHLTLKERMVSDLMEQLEELQDYKVKVSSSEQKIKDLEAQLSRQEGAQTVVKSLQSKLEKLDDLQRENRALRQELSYSRQSKENVFLLREETESLKKKLERAEERCAEVLQLKVENEALKSKLAQEGKDSTGPGNILKSPSQMTSVISELQSTNAILLERQGMLQSSTHGYEASLQNLEAKLQQTQSLKVELQMAKQKEEAVKRLQRRFIIVSKERDAYKEIIDSYEQEVAPPSGSAQSRRVRQLEETVTSYQKHMAEMEANLDRTNEQLAQSMSRTQMAENQVLVLKERISHNLPGIDKMQDSKLTLSLREKIAELEKKVEELELENENFKDRIEQINIQGGYDPRTTKVFHLSMNPASMAHQKATEDQAKLKAENEKLRERLRLMEESAGNVSDLTMKVETNVKAGTSKDVDDIKAQLESASVKNQRLMEAFKKKSHELREVIYLLLGYRIDFVCKNQYRLINMYATSAEEVLLFQHSDDGALQLMSNEFSTRLTDKVETYLEESHSIPAFLSSVTLDLFAQQTMM